MVRRASSAESTRERILDAAIALYSQRGIRATATGAVAARADVARATVLNHFGSADALASAAIEKIIRSLPVPTPAIFIGATSRADRLRRLVRALFTVYDKGEPWFTAFQSELASLDVLRQGEQRFWAQIAPLYADAMGPLARNRRARAAIATLTGPGTFSALKAAGLSAREAGEVVGDLVAGFARGSSRSRSQRA